MEVNLFRNNLDPRSVEVEPNPHLFASRVDIIVYDPRLGRCRPIRGKPAIWRPRPPADESCLVMSLVVLDSRWRKFTRALTDFIFGRV